MSTLRFKALSAALALAGLCTAAAAAQQLPVEGPVATTALINVESKSNAALNPSSLRLQVAQTNLKSSLSACLGE